MDAAPINSSQYIAGWMQTTQHKPLHTCTMQAALPFKVYSDSFCDKRAYYAIVVGQTKCHPDSMAWQSP